MASSADEFTFLAFLKLYGLKQAVLLANGIGLKFGQLLNLIINIHSREFKG